MKPAISCLLCILLLSCTQLFAQTIATEKKWTPENRSDFINECIATTIAGYSKDTATIYCYCMQEKMEKAYPNPDNLDKVSSETFQSGFWKAQVKACLNVTSDWASSDRSAFFEDCLSSAKQGLDEQKATSYCNCALYKIEKKFPKVESLKALTEDYMRTNEEFKKMVKDCLVF